MSKHFLPGPVSFDNEIGKRMVEGNLPSRTRMNSTCIRCLPIFTMLMLLGGGTLFGLSISKVPENHVGYYMPTEMCIGNCKLELYEQGVYFDIPWHHGSFHLVDISSRNITLGNDEGNNKTRFAHYDVVDPAMYVKYVSLYNHSPSKLENIIIQDVMKNTDMINDNSTYTTKGLEFTKLFSV